MSTPVPDDPAPAQRRGLTQRQILELMRSINPNHVENKQGRSYISQHQARAELTRLFGVGNWDSQVEEMTLVYEHKIVTGDPQFPKNAANDKVYYVACYRCSLRLNIRDYWGNPIASFVEQHAEENAPLPNRGEAHAMAVTSVESYALRRAALGLGDRLGLGLYDNGSLNRLVGRTLQLDDLDSPLYYDIAKAREEAAKEEAQSPAAQPITGNVDTRTGEIAEEPKKPVRNPQARGTARNRLQGGLKLDDNGAVAQNGATNPTVQEEMSDASRA